MLCTLSISKSFRAEKEGQCPMRRICPVVGSVEWVSTNNQIINLVNGFIFRFEALCKTFVSVVCSPQKLPLTTVINVLCCFSNFHGRLLRNAAFSRHTSEEMTMLSCVIELVDRMLLLNHRESVELKQWLSRYVRTINSHSGLFSVLQVVCRKDFLHNRIEIVQLLLEAGANPMARDHRGNTPLDCLSCYSDDYLAVVQLLIDFCPSGSAQRNPTPEEL